jgi:predicted ATPase/DNA-binding winged helix-turn-helix (wHTH) protein
VTQALLDDYFEFASFRLYPKQRRLLRDGGHVVIGGRAFDVLLLLVSKAGAIVSVGDLMHFAWPNLTVEDANLRVQMGTLRRILAACADARRAIATIPLRGYCFVLPVRHHPALAETGTRPPSAGIGLPILLTPVIGRSDAIEVIGRALTQRRLVTITGPGGIGKTTAAIAIARQDAAGFQQSSAFVDLSHITDAKGVMTAIAEALAIEVDGDVQTTLVRHLNAPGSLLVLDTCEHIVEAVADLARTLLGQCDGLRLLVTSREPLRAIGEWTHRLPSLTFPEEDEGVSEENLLAFSAITLFLERINACTRFTLERGDPPLLGEICRRLDGIPLALEFAAARAPDLGLRGIAAHLDDRFSILTRGRRTALPRHRTLSATLDWSYSLLSDDEVRVLHTLTTLSVGFTTRQAVGAGSAVGCEDAAEVLGNLYEKSLLAVDMRGEEPVYRLLDTTRAYIAAKAECKPKIQTLLSSGQAPAMPSIAFASRVSPRKQIASAHRLSTSSMA